MKTYDLVVFIGRFQPLTKMGHGEVINKAFSISDNVLIGIGSSNLEQSIKNPFTYDERAEIITEVYPSINCVPLDDKNSDEEWVENVTNMVKSKCADIGIDYDNSKIALIGMDKDASSYYLKYFPFWEFCEFPKPEIIVSATDVRESLFEENFEELKNLVHPSTFDFLQKFSTSNEFIELKEKYNEHK